MVVNKVEIDFCARHCLGIYDEKAAAAAAARTKQVKRVNVVSSGC